MIGAGKARIILYVNGLLNISRIVVVAICFIGGIENKEKLFNVIHCILWVIGLEKEPPSKENIKGNFYCICYTVAGTAMLKRYIYHI